MRIPKLPKVVEGLLWAMVGGASTSALELRQYLTQWKEYDIDFGHLASLAAVGAVLGGAMFLRDQAKRREIAEIAQTAAEAIAASSAAGQASSMGGGLGSIPPAKPGG